MKLIRQCVALFTALCLVIPALTPTARAMTTQEEKELAGEFLKAVRRQYKIVDDFMIDQYINELGQSILSPLPPQPFEYRFYVIQGDTINAFAGPAGNIFVFSGLFTAMDTESELAGIIAHEIAHVSSRHISELIEQSKKSQKVSVAGLIAGMLVGLGGASSLGSALSIGSLAAGQSMILAYTREKEMEADYLGRQYLTRAGYSLAGLREALEKIRAREWYGEEQVPTYLKTHPATRDRLANLNNMLAGRKDPKPKNSFAFERARAALIAEYGSPSEAADRFRQELSRNPDNAAAQYGLALAMAESGRPEEALDRMKKAVNLRPDDAYLKIDLGRICFMAGRYEEAEKVLAGIDNLTDYGPEGLFYLGRTHLARGNTEAAIAAFRKVAEAFPDYSRGLYFLGQSLGERNRLGEAHYYLGRYYQNIRQRQTALFHFKLALEKARDPELKQKIRKAQKSLQNLPQKPDKEDTPPGQSIRSGQNGRISW